MAEITAKIVNELRGRTGAGMMDCKKALVACEGDMDKAIDFLREKGLASAAKKQSVHLRIVCCVALPLAHIPSSPPAKSKNPPFGGFLRF